MTRTARFRVVGKLDRAGGLREGTVAIARGGDPMFAVRPLRSRRVYELPLSAVADLVVLMVVRAELRAKALDKANKAKARKVDQRLQRAARGGRRRAGGAA